MERLPILYNRKPCYDIVFSDSFDQLVEELRAIGADSRRICIVTDSKVDTYYGDTVKELLAQAGIQVYKFVFPEGEINKTLHTVTELCKFLIESGFDRKDSLLALGGGVVGDVTGYAAAIYLRGIRFIQVPTTLLSQADSSIGGKTGVDFEGYKNMIGAFHMPALVYMNLSTLSTLDERQYYSGFAEIMKHGLLKDTLFYEWLVENMYEIYERDSATMQEMLFRSCQIKKSIVEKDPKEQGDRALLNLGHTIGHAIEKAKNYTLYHGECVALGCVAAAYISWKKGVLSMEEYYEVRDMFVPFNLPITVDEINPQEILAFTKRDKKADAGKIRFVLLKKIGRAYLDTEVTDEEVLAAIREIHFSEEDYRA